MNILIVSKYYPPEKSTRSLQVGRLVNCLSRHQDINVYIIAGYRYGFDLQLEEDNVKYVPYNEPKSKFKKVNMLINSLSEGYFNNWCHLVFKEARKIIHDKNITNVITVSSTFDSHWVAEKLTNNYNDILVSTFISDPWPSSLLPHPYNRSAIPVVSKLNEIKVKKLFKKVDSVIATNDKAFDLYKEKGFFFTKTHTLPHFVEEKTSNEYISDESISYISYVGSLDFKRISLDVIRALEVIVKSRPNLMVRFVGDVQCDVVKALRSSLGEKVEFIDSVSSSLASQYCTESEVLLVLEANILSSPFIPSKFSDYLCSGASILAVTPESSALDTFFEQNNKNGFAVRNKKNDIIRALTKLLDMDNEKPIERTNYNDKITSNLISFLRLK